MTPLRIVDSGYRLDVLLGNRLLAYAVQDYWGWALMTRSPEGPIQTYDRVDGYKRDAAQFALLVLGEKVLRGALS